MFKGAAYLHILSFLLPLVGCKWLVGRFVLKNKISCLQAGNEKDQFTGLAIALYHRTMV